VVVCCSSVRKGTAPLTLYSTCAVIELPANGHIVSSCVRPRRDPSAHRPVHWHLSDVTACRTAPASRRCSEATLRFLFAQEVAMETEEGLTSGCVLHRVHRKPPIPSMASGSAERSAATCWTWLPLLCLWAPNRPRGLVLFPFSRPKTRRCGGRAASGGWTWMDSWRRRRKINVSSWIIRRWSWCFLWDLHSEN